MMRRLVIGVAVLAVYGWVQHVQNQRAIETAQAVAVSDAASAAAYKARRAQEAIQLEKDKKVCEAKGKPWVWYGHSCDKPCDYECVQAFKFERKWVHEYMNMMDPFKD